MDVQTVSSSSMHKEGLKLIADLWEEIHRITNTKAALDNPEALRHLTANLRSIRSMQPSADKAHDLMVLAAHRLAFLEMVTKGLSFMEQHDAQAYAKFIDKKRKIEDMDIDELRVLLR